MAEIRVPELSESVVEATVGEWLVKVGDSVGTDYLLGVGEDEFGIERVYRYTLARR